MKRIVIITREEPFIVPVYLSRLLEEHGSKIVHVFVGDAPSPHLTKKKLLVLCGVLPFLRMSIRYVMYRLLGKTSLLRDGKYTYSLSALLKRHDISSSGIENRERLQQSIEEIKPDILLSVANSRILPESILSQCGIALNVHGSLLPKYRGVLTAFWVLKNEEKRSGITIHEMLPEVDAGKIYGQRQVEIFEDDTVMSLYGRIAEAGRDLIADIVDDIDQLEPWEMPEDSTPMYGAPTFDDIHDFRKTGRKFC